MIVAIMMNMKGTIMNKCHWAALLSTFCLATAGTACAANDDTASGESAAHSAQAGTYSSQASGHASASVGHAIQASGQTTSAVSAVPLAISGGALTSGGAVSMGAAHGSAHAATSQPGKAPLEVTDETITVMPPNEALMKDQEGKKDQPEHKPGNNI